MVAPPEDDHLRHVIDTMALYVLDGGCAFEQAIMQRGRGNPLFNFLFELGSKEHTYYVWRLYSFAQVSLLVCMDHMNHMHLGLYLVEILDILGKMALFSCMRLLDMASAVFSGAL
jgi:hypothetical protein